MFKIRVLSKDDVIKSLLMQEVIETVEAVYKAKNENKAIVWPTVFYEFDPGKSDMDIKSGYLKDAGLYGHKTVTWFGENPEKGLPALIGTIVVYDAKTGAPLGIMDGSHITGMRTGAAGAIGAKYLARRDSENLLIVGAGHQAIYQIAAVLTALPKIKKVSVAALHFKNAKAFIRQVPGILKNNFKLDVDRVAFEAVSVLADAVSDSDIIITATPSKKPIIEKAWVKKGAHFSCMGADMEGKEELEPEILTSARIYVDDKEHCMEVGEMEIPLRDGFIKEGDIVGEIGDLILGKIKGRLSDDDITIYDSTGIALLDIAVARKALLYADAHGLGTEVTL